MTAVGLASEAPEKEERAQQSIHCDLKPHWAFRNDPGR